MWSMVRVATSGAQAQQRALDVAANNLAHAHTTGFKGQRADIVDLPPAERTCTVAGALVAQGLELAQGAGDATIDDRGTITARVGNARQEIGNLQLVRFVNSDGLVPLGNSLVGASVAAGDPISGRPGTEGLGEL